MKPIVKIHSDGYWTSLPGFKEPLNFASMELCQIPPPLTEEQIENAIDAANRKFNARNMSPRGQILTSYDDWKHWLAREIEMELRK
jgi:hypothetical protein